MPYHKAEPPTHTVLGCALHTCIRRKPCWCATPLRWCCVLVRVVLPQAMQLFASLSVLTRTARGSPGLHFNCDAEHDTESVPREAQLHMFWDIWGVKFQGSPLLHFAGLTVLFPGVYFLLSLKLWPSWLQRNAWKHGILQYSEVWLMTFYHEGHILLPPFNFPLSLCMQPHLQMFREECLHPCTLKAASVYAKVSTRVHRCHYSQRAGAGVLLDGAACV